MSRGVGEDKGWLSLGGAAVGQQHLQQRAGGEVAGAVAGGGAHGGPPTRGEEECRGRIEEGGSKGGPGRQKRMRVGLGRQACNLNV